MEINLSHFAVEFAIDMLLSCTKFSSITGGVVSCPLRAVLLAASRPVCVLTYLGIYLMICNNFKPFFPIPLTSFLIYIVVSCTELRASVNVRRLCF
jgi:hypothetical protein